MPGLGSSSVGGTGEGGNWNGFSLTTNSSASTESSTTFDQTIGEILIINDGSSDIDFDIVISITLIN